MQNNLTNIRPILWIELINYTITKSEICLCELRKQTAQKMLQ
jgi:hypothetical protein